MGIGLPGWALALIAIVGFVLMFVLDVQVARGLTAIGQWLHRRGRREPERNLPSSDRTGSTTPRGPGAG